MGWVSMVSATRSRSTIIKTILSIFTVFCFINTRDLTSHYVFQVEVNMNWCIRELLTILSFSLLFTVMLTSLRKLLSNIHLWVFTLPWSHPKLDHSCSLLYTDTYSYIVYTIKEYRSILNGSWDHGNFNKHQHYLKVTMDRFQVLSLLQFANHDYQMVIPFQLIHQIMIVIKFKYKLKV